MVLNINNKTNCIIIYMNGTKIKNFFKLYPTCLKTTQPELNFFCK